MEKSSSYTKFINTIRTQFHFFKLQVLSPDMKEEEKEEGEHVDDDVDSLNGEDA